MLRAYEDDFEPDDEDMFKSGEPIVTASDTKKSRPNAKSSEDDIYDFSTPNLGY